MGEEVRTYLVRGTIPPPINLNQGFKVRLYMDDVRKCPVGWHLARTVEEAISIMSKYKIEEASLDHDMGACKNCLATDGSLIHCPHVPDGRSLVSWMKETGIWPVQKPKVHSMNPEGKKTMEEMIDSYWRKPVEDEQEED